MEQSAQAAATFEVEEVYRELPGRRRVYRSALQESPVVIKEFLPHRKQQRDFSREFSALKTLEKRGINGPRAIMAAREGERWFIAIKFIESAEPLSSLLPKAKKAERRPLFEALLNGLVEHYAKGAVQRDAHLDNFLIREGELITVDAAGFRFAKGEIDRREALENLALVAANLRLALQDEFVELAASAFHRKLGFSKKELDSAVRRALEKRAGEYFRKTRRSSTEIRYERLGEKRVWALRNLPEEVVEAVRETPDRLIKEGRVLKPGNTSTVAEVIVAGRQYILKRYNEKPLFHRAVRMGQASRAIRSWSNGQVLHLLGLPTARPLVCVEERSGPLLKRGFLLMEKVEGRDLLAWAGENREEVDALAREAFFPLWRHLGKLRAAHGDLKATNLIVCDGGLRLLDLDAMRLFLPDRNFERLRRKDRDRFLRNWRGNAEAEAAFHGISDIP